MEKWLLLLIIVAVIVVGLVYGYILYTSLYGGYGGTVFGVPYVAVIKLRGTIGYEQQGLLSWSKTITPDDVKELVDRVLGDPYAKAVVLVINSPGGSAAASEDIYWLIKELSDEKPVVVYGEEVLASGGYYIALPADEIIASPHCITGSIGSVMVVYDVSKLLKVIGVNVTVLKSGKFKDIASMYKPLSSDELRILSEIVNRTAEVFKERVLENRGHVNPEVFDARIYIGEDAVKVGLVDMVGDYNKAIEEARKLAGLPPTAPVRVIEKPKGLLEALLGVNLNDIIRQLIPVTMGAQPVPQIPYTHVQVLYIWMP